MLTKAVYSRKRDISWSDLYLLCNLIYIFIFIYLHIQIYLYIYIIIYIYITPSSFRNRGGADDLHQGFKLGSEAGKPDWMFIPAVPRSEITMFFAFENGKNAW